MTPPPTRDLLPRARWTPAVRAAVEEMVVAHGRTSPSYDAAAPPLAVFDWDNTCIRGDIGEGALLALDAADGGGRMATYEAMVASEGKPAAYAWCAFALAGLTEPEVRRLAQEVLRACLAAGTMAERPEVRDLIWALQRHGWDVRVVSASAEPLVQAVAQGYGVPADRVLGVRLARGPGERYLPELAGPLTFRRGKVDAIDRFVGRPPLFAAGDTDTDIEMLEQATFRLVLGDSSPELLDRAREGGWWTEPGW